MTDFWKGRHVLVTGATGFIGSHVVDRLVNTRGVSRANIKTTERAKTDLRVFTDVMQAMQGCDTVLHVAGDVGGVSYATEHPGSQLYNNCLMDLQVLQAARQQKVNRVLVLSCVTAYPSTADSPLDEAIVFNGPITGAAIGIGYSRRNSILASQLFHKEFGLNVSVIVGNNAYGPRDELDMARAHVIPATIMKCMNEPALSVWGDGKPLRDFTYVEDIAEGVLLGAEKLETGAYVNIGSGTEEPIKKVVELCVKYTGFKGPVTYDASKPGGPARRSASIAKANSMIGYTPAFPLERGLERTVEWYREALKGKK